MKEVLGPTAMVTATFEAVFVPAAGTEDFGAKRQSELIAERLKDGWDWQGFIAVSRGVLVKGVDLSVVGAATETAGCILYFKMLSTDVTHVMPSEMAPGAKMGRALRRRIGREVAKQQRPN